MLRDATIVIATCAAETIIIQNGLVRLNKKLILHAGQHKTGTSAIQNYFFEEFKHPTIAYIHAEIANSSLWMLQAFKRDLPQRPNFDRLKKRSHQKNQAMRKLAKDKLESRIIDTDKPVHVLSAESLSL